MALLGQIAQRRQHRVGPGRLGSLADLAELLEQACIAVEMAGVGERDQIFRVVGVGLPEIRDFPHVMPDVEAQVPQRVQHRLQETLVGGADRPAEQEQQVDVGVQAQLPSAVAAHGHDRHRRVGLFARCAVDLTDDPVDLSGVARQALAAPARGQRVGLQFFARRAQDVRQRIGRRRRW